MPAQSIATVFRIGVTGSIDTGSDDTAALESRLLETVRAIRDAVAGAARDDALKGIAPADSTATLRVLSPLAEGADRLLAAAALKLDGPECDIRLDVPMPFAQADYETTFSTKDPSRRDASIAEFRRLLEYAEGRVFEMDGALQPDDVRHASYAAAGQAVASNSDLLIAVWDPEKHSDRPGGTRDTLLFGLRIGVPVLLLDPLGAHPPRWIRHRRDIDIARSEDALPATREYVRAQLLPPPEKDRSGRFIRFLRRRFRVEADPLRGFLREDGRLNRHFWRAHEANMATLKYLSARWCGYTDVPRPKRDWRWLLKFWARQDAPARTSSDAARFSAKYQQRYRTSYLLVLAAGALALAIGSAALAQTLSAAWIVAELLCLLLIATLWVVNVTLRWHSRYIAYRLLAELLRAAKCLQNTAQDPPGSRLAQANDGRQRWVVWLYAALTRANPLPTSRADVASKQTIQAGALAMIASQRSYHAKRRRENHATEQVVGGIAAYAFLLTLLVVIAKLVIHMHEEAIGASLAEPALRTFAYLAVGLPIAAATLYSMRSYEEFGILADQSELAIDELDAIERRIAEIDPTAPLSLQDLGGEAQTLGRLLISDAREWAQVFKLKAVEV